jgi:hypothetical protein
VAGTIRPGCTNSANFVSRSSGTVITPTLGSMVQKGKFAACAFALDRQLNNVDLPTFGSPTIPHFNAIFFYKRLFRLQRYFKKCEKQNILRYFAYLCTIEQQK